jgi:hypothetical protein
MKTEGTVHEVIVLSNNKELQANLEKENITEMVISDLKTKYSGLEIKGMDDKAGYNAVDEARKEVKRIRVMAEKIVKTETDKAFQAHKLAVADGKKVVARFTEIEESLQKKQAVIDDENKRLAEIKEQERKAKVTQRIKELQAYNYQGDLMVIEFISDEQFHEKLSAAKSAYETEQNRIAEEKRLRDEETARLQKQKEEQEAEAKRLKAIADQLSETQRKIDAENLRIENEKKAAAEKIIRDKELKEAEERAAVKALAEAEEKRIANQKAAEEKADKEKAEAERIEALKPVKEKLTAWVNGFSIEISGELTDHPAVKTIFEKHAAFKAWAQKEIEAIS